MNNLEEDDLFAVLKEIEARLTPFMQEWGVLKIYTPMNVGATSELSQVTPNIQVNYRRMRKTDDKARGRAVALAPQWEVTVVVRHAASQLDATQAFLLGGVLIKKVIKKLIGWQPKSSNEPLSLLNIDHDISKMCLYVTGIFESKTNVTAD